MIGWSISLAVPFLIAAYNISAKVWDAVAVICVGVASDVSIDWGLSVCTYGLSFATYVDGLIWLGLIRCCFAVRFALFPICNGGWIDMAFEELFFFILVISTGLDCGNVEWFFLWQWVQQV